MRGIEVKSLTATVHTPNSQITRSRDFGKPQAILEDGFYANEMKVTRGLTLESSDTPDDVTVSNCVHP